MKDLCYAKAIQLLQKASSPQGFLASIQNTSNYKRVWARDGVICGLAALSSGKKELIDTFRNTLETLAKYQHQNGTIPSNVMINDTDVEVSYGGLAGRVDAVTWFLIGICQYAFYNRDEAFVKKHETHIQKALQLLEAWEFNNKGLLYVPLSGNWADEYITEGYVLYDQLLRIWALKSYNYFAKDEKISSKMEQIKTQIEINFTPNSEGEKYHQRAYDEMNFEKFMPCSFSPAGYKTQFDALANSLVLYLNIGSEEFQKSILEYSIQLTKEMSLKLLPAFWPPIQDKDLDWNLLKNNYKYEFRNHPNEFHNGGSWAMINGFFGVALLSKSKKEDALVILNAINEINAVEDFSFYENFNSKTKLPNGIPFCAWSAAATVILNQSLMNNFKFLV